MGWEVMAAAVVALGLAVAFAATFGFGDALLAMPVLALLCGPRTAAPVMTLTGLLLAALVVWRAWPEVERGEVLRMWAGAVFTAPLGAWALGRLPAEGLLDAVGLVLLGYGSWALVSGDRAKISQGWAFPAGLFSGFLAGAVSTSGPPVIVYTSLRQLPPARMRASLQAYFFGSSLLAAGAHAAGGLWTSEVLGLAAAAVPAILAGTWLGSRLHRRLSVERYRRGVLVALVVMGAALVLA